VLTISKWIPPHLVHLIVQYSEPDRPAMTRRIASRALHCGQLESTVAEGDWVGPDSGMGCGLAPGRSRVEDNMDLSKWM
jgi:hypothetical protein